MVWDGTIYDEKWFCGRNVCDEKWFRVGLFATRVVWVRTVCDEKWFGVRLFTTRSGLG